MGLFYVTVKLMSGATHTFGYTRMIQGLYCLKDHLKVNYGNKYSPFDYIRFNLWVAVALMVHALIIPYHFFLFVSAYPDIKGFKLELPDLTCRPLNGC